MGLEEFREVSKQEKGYETRTQWLHISIHYGMKRVVFYMAWLTINAEQYVNILPSFLSRAHATIPGRQGNPQQVGTQVSTGTVPNFHVLFQRCVI